MSTWYWKGNADTNWSNLFNWWSNSNGTGFHPSSAPWTQITTYTFNLQNATPTTRPPIINVTIGAGIPPILGVCSITNITLAFDPNPANGIYQGTFTGSGFNNNGKIFNGVFGSGFANHGVVINMSFQNPQLQAPHWYFLGTNNNNWSDPGNWWQDPAFPLENPPAAPWTTNDGYLNASELRVFAPGLTVDVPIGDPYQYYRVSGNIMMEGYTLLINSNINSGNFYSNGVTSYGNIYGGTFSMYSGFDNEGNIYNGTFNSYDIYGVDIGNNNNIYGGTFNCRVGGYGTITDGIFNGSNTDLDGGTTVNGGTWNGSGLNILGASVYGGIWNGNNYHLFSSVYGGIWNGNGVLNSGIVNGGIWNGTGFSNGGYGTGYIFDGTFNQDVTNNESYIYGGIFNGIIGNVDQYSWIYGGDFYADNISNYGRILGGTWHGDGFINYYAIGGGTWYGSYFYNNGDITDGVWYGNNIFNNTFIYGGTWHGSSFINSGTISNGTFLGSAFTNGSIIIGATFGPNALDSIIVSNGTITLSGIGISMTTSEPRLDVMGGGLL